MNEKIQSIGIDVSKLTLDVCLLDPKLKVINEFKVDNSVKGINSLISKMKNFSILGSFVMEATSSYHLLLALTLKSKGYSVKVYNPILNQKYTKGAIRKCKTDKVDAKKIARIGIFEDLQEFAETKEHFMLKRLISLMHSLIGQRQRLKSSFNHFVEDSKNLDVPLFESAETTNLILNNFHKTIIKMEKEIIREASKISGEDLHNISEIKGVTKRSASVLLTYVEKIKFKNKSAINAFFGLDVSTKQSGTSIRGKGSISKRGCPIARKVLAQSAWGLMMHNSLFQQLASYYKAKGRHYFEILVILSRKLLHIIYGMMKTHSPFDPTKIVIPVS